MQLNHRSRNNIDASYGHEEQNMDENQYHND